MTYNTIIFEFRSNMTSLDYSATKIYQHQMTKQLVYLNSDQSSTQNDIIFEPRSDITSLDYSATKIYQHQMTKQLVYSNSAQKSDQNDPILYIKRGRPFDPA